MKSYAFISSLDTEQKADHFIAMMARHTAKETSVSAITSISLPVDHDCIENCKATCCDIQRLLDERILNEKEKSNSSKLATLFARMVIPRYTPGNIPEIIQEEKEEEK